MSAARKSSAHRRASLSWSLIATAASVRSAKVVTACWNSSSNGIASWHASTAVASVGASGSTAGSALFSAAHAVESVVGQARGHEPWRMAQHQVPRFGKVKLIASIGHLLVQHGRMDVQLVESRRCQRPGIGVHELDQRLVEAGSEVRLDLRLQVQPGKGLPRRRFESRRVHSSNRSASSVWGLASSPRLSGSAAVTRVNSSPKSASVSSKPCHVGQRSSG